jgi:hypothetical protein
MNNSKCPKNQVYNPDTKRCIKKDSKKGIEILFKNKDKEILKSFELVNGKIVKKCPKDKIRNPQTLRCIKSKKPTKEPSKKPTKEPSKKPTKEPTKEQIKDLKKISRSLLLNKRTEAVNKIKKALSPFLKRVSADIYTRVRYMMMMKRELKKVIKKDNVCLRIYKKNRDGTYKYRIGSNIILNKRIGTESAYGEAYLSEFREKSKKLFTFVSKIYKIFDDTALELALLTLLTNKVRMGQCPHFPIIYGYVQCSDLRIPNNKTSSFKQTNSKQKEIKQILNKYPIIYQKILDDNGSMITLFNELANGDLKSFLIRYQGHTNKLLNSYIQILLSIIFFYYHTDMKHNDCHWGNFLFHKIKSGGYFHYKIFGQDFYLENIGFLWVIWDLELATPLTMEIASKRKICAEDFLKISLNYLPTYKIDPKQQIIGGNHLIDDGVIAKYKMEEIFKIIYKFCDETIFDLDIEFTYQNLMIGIEDIIEYFKNNHWLLTKLPSGEKVINKEPYVISEKFKSRH